MVDSFLAPIFSCSILRTQAFTQARLYNRWADCSLSLVHKGSAQAKVAWGCSNLENPYPYRGGGREGTKPTCRIPLFLLGNPGIVIQSLKWKFKVTFLDKPWALVRKYLVSASVKMAAQFLEGCHPTHVLLQSDMCLAPPELSASIWFSSVCQWYGMTRNVDHWEK